jgi:NAD(P)-dependent dehydrogenase (short-subunit alcohol dehydrogenase family)
VLAHVSARVGSIEDNRLGGWYAYRASKAAQNMFTRTLAIELARRAPNVICLALHPGTVDTALSRPFQGSFAAERLFDPKRAADQLLGVIDSCTREDSGRFLAWDGQPIPW